MPIKIDVTNDDLKKLYGGVIRNFTMTQDQESQVPQKQITSGVF